MANGFVNITSNTTTTISSTASVNLRRVVINTKGATGNTLKLYSGASAAAGVLIGTIDTTTAVDFIDYDLCCHGGLVAVTATGTAADITIIFD